MTLKELRINNQGKHLTYSQYLIVAEWKQKKEEINKRDNYYCTNCGKAETIIIPHAKKEGVIHHVWLEDDEVIDLGKGNFTIGPKIVFSDKHYHLEAHHTRYILNRLPWDYKNEDLITLCNHCHTEFHQHNKVPVYSEDELIELEYEPCPNCNGTGYIPEYKHVQAGICFQCNGEKYLTFLIR